MDAGHANLKPRALCASLPKTWRCKGEDIKAGVIRPAICTFQNIAGGTPGSTFVGSLNVWTRPQGKFQASRETKREPATQWVRPTHTVYRAMSLAKVVEFFVPVV